MLCQGSSSLGPCAPLSVHVVPHMVLVWLRAFLLSCFVARSLCFYWLRAFMFVMFCVNTLLMSLLISCVFVSCFTHGKWICFAGHVLVFLFCVSTWLVLFGSMCSHVYCLDPTPLVIRLLVHFPHLCVPRYLLICSLFILLVFAVLCQFVVVWCVCTLCPALFCQPVKLPVCFPYGVVSVCLFYFITNKALIFLHYGVLTPSLQPSPDMLQNICMTV